MRKALFFLGILSDSDIDWLIGAGRRQPIAAGTVLIKEGIPVDAIYILLDGVLKVSSVGVEQVEIARLRSGEVVGEMSFVDARPPSATVSALEDSVVLAVPRAQLNAKLKDAEFAARFYRALAVFLADRLRTTVGWLGYGRRAVPDRVDEEDELDSDVLEGVAMAGARFEWLLQRLRGA
jgi:bacteriocin-type transport-associated protein